LRRRRYIKKKPVNKKVRNATTCRKDGIQFKSKLELYTYTKLKQNKLGGEYEKHKFNLLEKFEFKNKSYEKHKKKGSYVYGELSRKIRGITYTPDFVKEKDRWIIECKGYANDQFPLRWKLFKKMINKNNLNFDLYLPTNKTQVDETIRIINIKKNGSDK
jgi:hypothetical protein